MPSPIANSLLIEDFNNLKLYAVQESVGETGKKIYVIQRVKISENDVAERIQAIMRQMDEGKIWIKTGKIREGTVKYAGKNLNADQIQSITLERTNKMDFEITKDFDQYVEGMQEKHISRIEKVMNALKQRFAQASPKSQPYKAETMVVPQSTKKAAKELEMTLADQSLALTRSTEEKQKEMVKNQQEGIEASRTKKRKLDELALESDQNADEIRLKDVRLNQEHSDIAKEDIKKTSKKVKRLNQKNGNIQEDLKKSSKKNKR